ncbi:MAG TPA: hypothetical protein VMM78_08830 [Thermomicrobiales bacterium]|nr:hypothetical protein [Thermomicrobiales bacterium]
MQQTVDAKRFVSAYIAIATLALAMVFSGALAVTTGSAGSQALVGAGGADIGLDIAHHLLWDWNPTDGAYQIPVRP